MQVSIVSGPYHSFLIKNCTNHMHPIFLCNSYSTKHKDSFKGTLKNEKTHNTAQSNCHTLDSMMLLLRYMDQCGEKNVCRISPVFTGVNGSTTMPFMPVAQLQILGHPAKTIIRTLSLKLQKKMFLSVDSPNFMWVPVLQRQ